MDYTVVLVFLSLTVTLLAATWHAWRLRNERRDVALLATLTGLFGIGTAVAVV